MRKVIIIVLTGILTLLCVSVEGQAQCDWIPGDINCSGTPFELSDMVYLIATYRGVVEACYFCDCGIYGGHFPVSADPDGNCIPFEISDIYYGRTPRICPDCLEEDNGIAPAKPRE